MKLTPSRSIRAQVFAVCFGPTHRRMEKPPRMITFGGLSLS